MKPADVIYIFREDGEYVWCDTDESQDSHGIKYLRNSLMGNLNKENDELKAHCERLRETLDEAICLLVTALHEPDQITHDDIGCYRDAERAVPEQSLNELKAQAIEEVVKECMSSSDDVMVEVKATQLMCYANKLRGYK